MGLSAINTYIGGNKIEDYVKYVRNDLMGIIREDLVFDLGRHVDNSVHLFEEWGLPIWKKGDDGFSLDGFQAKDAGKPLLKDCKDDAEREKNVVRSGKWQAMINGESYKVIVAEAAKKALQMNREATGVKENHFERVFITRLLLDANKPNTIAGAIGFSVRENKIYIFKAKAMLLVPGGCVNVFRPRSIGEEWEGHGSLYGTPVLDMRWAHRSAQNSHLWKTDSCRQGLRMDTDRLAHGFFSLRQRQQTATERITVQIRSILRTQGKIRQVC